MDPNINDSLRASPVSAQQPLPYRKIGIILIFVLIAVGVMIGLFLRDSQSGLIVNLPGNHSKGIGVSPTPMPYAELTIPYLRNREYSSTLHERQVYSNGSTYTSYLTSYDSDGLKINGLLTIPTTEMPEGGYPAIVFVHGYIPPAQYSTTEKYADYVDYLARNGFVVFKIDLRGHGNSQGDPSGAYFSPDYVIDTLNARAALQTSDFVNPDEVGLWGHSMAGNVVMRAMTARPEIQAGVIWAGAVYTYTDMREYGIQDNSYQRPVISLTPRPNSRQRIGEVHGEPESNSPFWQQMAPTNYLTDLKGAVQLNHATNDDVVTVQYSRDLNRLLDATSVPHELHEYSSGGHNIDGSAFVEAMGNTVAFYKKYLQ